MKPLTINEIAKAIGGKLNNPENNPKMGETLINGISFDTREDLKGKLFVPLKGANADGHKFLQQAIEKGANCVLSQEPTDIPTAIIVDNTLKALANLAEYYRNLFNIKVVAITGSSGKTSAKDMVAAVLAEKFNVVKTEGNFNNEIGLPMTIFNINDTTEIAVLEMGMNNRHEIHRLSKIARPDMAIITNIGTAHIENLGSQEEIFKAKSEIMDFLASDGKIFLHGDDEFLSRYKDRNDVIFYGRSDFNAYRPENEVNHGLDGSSYTIKLNHTANPNNGQTAEIRINSPGTHMVLNSLAAVAVGDYMGLTAAQIASGLARFKLSDMRMALIKTKSGINIIADCYNANPDSMRAALAVLAQAGGPQKEGRTIAVLGDMRELGEISQEKHFEIGQEAARLPIDKIICIGTESRAIHEGAESYKGNSTYFKNSVCFKNSIYFKNKEEFIASISGITFKPGDTVLVKASRGLKFEEIVKTLEEI
jgi:UDP-N-acetylmuramoyl-tripeptide--D-alanyl-D-alanine ligase